MKNLVLTILGASLVHTSAYAAVYFSYEYKISSSTGTTPIADFMDSLDKLDNVEEYDVIYCDKLPTITDDQQVSGSKIVTLTYIIEDQVPDANVDIELEELNSVWARFKLQGVWKKSSNEYLAKCSSAHDDIK